MVVFVWFGLFWIYKRLERKGITGWRAISLLWFVVVICIFEALNLAR